MTNDGTLRQAGQMHDDQMIRDLVDAALTSVCGNVPDGTLAKLSLTTDLLLDSIDWDELAKQLAQNSMLAFDLPSTAGNVIVRRLRESTMTAAGECWANESVADLYVGLAQLIDAIRRSVAVTVAASD